jgi:hypothetical protein
MKSRWSSFFRKVIFLLLPAGLCCGCVPQHSLLPPDLTAERALQAINASVSEAQILSAVARIELVTPAGHYPARAALILRKPSFLRLELIPPIGTPDFLLTATPEEMKILLPAKGEFYYGKPTGNNLAKFLPWSFAVEDIVAIFSGGYPPLMDIAAYRSQAEKNVLRIEMTSSSRRSQTLWVDRDCRLLRLVRYAENGNELYSAKYEDYRGKETVARKITVNMAGGITSISVDYSHLSIETAADLSVFDLAVPSGFKALSLD